MNYLARICLGALCSPLFPFPTIFSLHFRFDLRLLFFPELCSSSTKCLFFSTELVPIAPGTFCRVLPAALGSHLISQFCPRKLLPTKSLCALMLSVLYSLNKNLQYQYVPRSNICCRTFPPNKFVPPPHWQTFFTAIHLTDNWQLATPKW